MKLTDVQLKAMADWFAAGESLSNIQRLLESEFGINVTYLDVRLAVADLPQPVEPESVSAPEPASVEALQPDTEDARNEVAPEEANEQMPASDVPPLDEGTLPTGDVMVEMDAIVIPGAMASGSVTFSDGQSGKWYVDQMGRMGLSGFGAGYRPSQADAATFQQKLMALFRSKGLIP